MSLSPPVRSRRSSPPPCGERPRWSRSSTRRPRASCARCSSACRLRRSWPRGGWRGAEACTGTTWSCFAITYVAHRARHHGRLPPAVHPPQLQDEPAAAGAVRRARLDGRRGPADRLGRDPPQAPPLLRPPRRPAQPPRRPRAGMARRAARARPRAPRLDAARQGHGRTLAATPRICSPTATCASSAGRSRSGWRPGSRCRSASAGRITGSIAGGLTGLLWGGAVRIFVLHHVTFSINSLCHCLRAAAVHDPRSGAQPRLARPDRLRRGVAQQPPRLPDLRPPRPEPLADRPRRLAHRRPRALPSRLGRRPDQRRATGVQARRVSRSVSPRSGDGGRLSRTTDDPRTAAGARLGRGHQPGLPLEVPRSGHRGPDPGPVPAPQRRRAVSLEWFAIGWLVAILAWALHVGALALAPLSIVQAVLSGGLVFLAVLAERFFDFHLGRGSGSASSSRPPAWPSSASPAAAQPGRSAPRWPR